MNTDFREKGASPTNHSWYQSNIVIALSCGIKISVVRHLVLSQCTHVTYRQTDGRTDRQNYDSQDCPRICSRGKNGSSCHLGSELLCHTSVTTADTCLKFGTYIDIGHMSVIRAQISISLKFKMAAAAIK